jgi:phosphopantothenoylcysteine decarboxylase/phosphopantothenate--cysteine ligase
MHEKGLHLLVANDVSAGAVFGSDVNHVFILDRDGGVREVGPAPKGEVAEHILDVLAPLLRRRI